jgi:hypothetical protein
MKDFMSKIKYLYIYFFRVFVKDELKKNQISSPAC